MLIRQLMPFRMATITTYLTRMSARKDSDKKRSFNQLKFEKRIALIG